MSIPNAWKRRATKTSVNLEQSTHFQFTVDLNNNEGALNTNSFIYSRSTTSQHIDNTNPTVACISSPVSITGHAEERIFDCVFASEGHDVSRLWSSFASPEGQREKEEDEILNATEGQRHGQVQEQEHGEREREKQIQSTGKDKDKKWRQ